MLLPALYNTQPKGIKIDYTPKRHNDEGVHIEREDIEQPVIAGNKLRFVEVKKNGHLECVKIQAKNIKTGKGMCIWIIHENGNIVYQGGNEKSVGLRLSGSGCVGTQSQNHEDCKWSYEGCPGDPSCYTKDCKHPSHGHNSGLGCLCYLADIPYGDRTDANHKESCYLFKARPTSQDVCG